jgi:hypothetical protein
MRKLRTALVVTALALVAVPTATATQPYTEPIDLEPHVFSDCGYDIGFEPDGTDYMRIFDSGRFTVHSHGSPTLTNLETGESKTYRLRYQFQDTGDGHGQISGRFLFVILPGDVGPSGEVDPDGGLVHIVGRLELVADPETFAITSFQVSGRLTDVCAALA